MRDARRPSDGGVTFGCVESVGCGADAEMWCHVREYASFVCFPMIRSSVLILFSAVSTLLAYNDGKKKSGKLTSPIVCDMTTALEGASAPRRQWYRFICAEVLSGNAYMAREDPSRGPMARLSTNSRDCRMFNADVDIRSDSTIRYFKSHVPGYMIRKL